MFPLSRVLITTEYLKFIVVDVIFLLFFFALEMVCSSQPEFPETSDIYHQT